MAKYNKTQQYAVLWLSHSGADAKKIAEELELTIKQVNYIINQNNKNPVGPDNDGKQSVVKNLIITESAAGRQSVAVMTKEASQISDDQNIKYKTNNIKLPHIFNPYKKT
jgi:hypothetical protein